MALKLKEFGFEAKLGGVGGSATWEPNHAEQLAAWRLLLQLGTRTTVTPLPDDQGSLVAALTSLYSLFEITRTILMEAGPDAAAERPNGDPSLASIATWVLNQDIRPVLTKWHPELDGYMETKDPNMSSLARERAWPDGPALREELVELRQTLRNYLRLLGAAAGTKTFADALTPEN